MLNVENEAGNVECNADQSIQVSVKGGKLLAFGSANPRTEEAFVSGKYATYYGRGQIIVMKEEAGELKVTAECAQFGTEKIKIQVI